MVNHLFNHREKCQRKRQHKTSLWLIIYLTIENCHRRCQKDYIKSHLHLTFFDILNLNSIKLVTNFQFHAANI